MKKTIVFCAVNSKFVHSSLAPWYLSAAVEAKCFERWAPLVLEGSINEAPDRLFAEFYRNKPTVLGFSVYIWNKNYILSLLPRVKELLPHTKIVLGGPEVSYCAEEVLKNSIQTDYVLSGEGEVPIVELLTALDEDLDLRSVHGLSFRDAKEIQVGTPYCAIDEPPSPYTETYLSALRGRIAYLETSRGCPFHCAFCLSGRQGSVRFFSLERACREILLLANSGTKTVKFIDRTFNADPRRAYQIFSFILEHYGKEIPKDVCFHFEIAGELLEQETFELLRKMPKGVIQFEIGLQSFHEETLHAIQRKTDSDRLAENIRRVRSMQNIHLHIDLIAGLPYEDLATFSESFDQAFSLSPHMLQLGFLKLLYGAPMRDHPESYPCVYAETPPYEVVETPWISKKELQSLHDTEAALDRLWNSGKFCGTVKYLTRACGYSPFRLFSDFGIYVRRLGKEHCALSEYAELFYAFLASDGIADMARVRDLLVCDILQNVFGGFLPYGLRSKDPRMTQIKKSLDKDRQTKRRTNAKRSITELPSFSLMVYADYSLEEKNAPYPLHFFLKN